MKWENQLTQLLKIKYPFIQAPMLGVTTPQMVAAIANEGGLGSLPVGGLSPEKTLDLIRKTKALTDKHFSVNLFTYPIPPIPKVDAHQMQQYLKKISEEYGIDYEETSIDDFRFYSYKEQISILLEEQIPIVSFTFGIPDDADIKTLQDNGVLLMGTATSLKEAQLLDEKNIDIMVTQGIEAGGHRGSFLYDDESLPQVSGAALLTEILVHISRPVVAAGGIADGKALSAALLMGAAAAQVGTAFIASNESAAIPAYKQALRQATATDTTLTRAFSGRWARGIRNKFMDLVENSDLSIPPYPIQNTLTTALRAAAQKQNNKDFTNLWAGQCAFMAEEKPAAEIFRSFIKQAEEIN
jgi:nitronate monooxygenase